jgi:hypothetical protein
MEKKGIPMKIRDLMYLMGLYKWELIGFSWIL